MPGAPNGIREVAVDARNGNIWATSNSRLYLYDSTSWVQKYIGSNNSIAVALNGTLYAGMSGSGVYRSTNGGVNWLPSSNYTTASIIRLDVVDNNILSFTS